MEINGKVWCLFEQSGTFKNEFKKLGYEAVDVDIQNNFGETDYQIDLFAEIENAYDGRPSLFDEIRGGQDGDLVLAFFPCIYFETIQQTYYSLENVNLRSLDTLQKIEYAMDRLDKRTHFHKLLYKLYALCFMRDLRLIIENPATVPNYLMSGQNFPQPSIIDKNRMTRGDYFKKPTAYWFVNCTPTHGYSWQHDKEQKVINQCKGGKQAGICSEERSMISPDYARNFVCDFILGKKQEHTQLTFDDIF